MERVPAERPWETVGYSRAVRSGDFIEVAGTSATAPDGSILHPGDAYAQTRHCLEVIVDAVQRLGGQASDIVRTRLFVTDVSQWKDVGKAHHEIFAEIRPASSLVEVKGLLDPGLVVEIEASAIVS